MTMILDGTNGAFLPSWTTATRPASPANGLIGYNSTTSQLDQYVGGAWASVPTGSASAGGSTTQLQYNNAGAFAGISGATTDGTRITHSTTVGVGGATPSTSGSGITFPATQSASTNANTLDDYERGTWTPTIIAATGNVTSQTCSGSYVKIGKLVYVTFSIKPDTGTISEIDHIDGLPYATDSISPAGFGSARSNATGNMWFTRTISSDSSIYLAQYNNTSSLSAGQTIIGAIAYIAAT